MLCFQLYVFIAFVFSSPYCKLINIDQDTNEVNVMFPGRSIKFRPLKLKQTSTSLASVRPSCRFTGKDDSGNILLIYRCGRLNTGILIFILFLNPSQENLLRRRTFPAAIFPPLTRRNVLQWRSKGGGEGGALSEDMIQSRRRVE